MPVIAAWAWLLNLVTPMSLGTQLGLPVIENNLILHYCLRKYNLLVVWGINRLSIMDFLFI
jgi:hypothetical protein